MRHVKIVILAAGKGKRMGLDVPKVLAPFNGQPMIKHLLGAIFKSGVDSSPIIVVSPENKNIIAGELKEYNLQYALQTQQLGTADALRCAQEMIGRETESVIVINGDHPFVRPETIKKLLQARGDAVTMLTTEVGDFNDWRANFWHWGRIIRKNGEIVEIKEFKDADEEIKKTREVNPAMYMFASDWLWTNIKKINNSNAQAEYYLTDMIRLAFIDRIKIGSIAIDPKEAMGINSQEELKIAEEIHKNN